MEKKLSIELAGVEYTIRPLTVGQLEAIHVEMLRDNPKPEEAVAHFWRINVATIAAACSTDHPEMTDDHIRKMRLGSLQSVQKTVDDIRVFAGLAVRKEADAKEASDAEGKAAGAE